MIYHSLVHAACNYLLQLDDLLLERKDHVIVFGNRQLMLLPGKAQLTLVLLSGHIDGVRVVVQRLLVFSICTQTVRMLCWLHSSKDLYS